ncbi:MAG: hypothetical protein DCC75_04495, partial [Proteobacteria bacterium]
MIDAHGDGMVDDAVLADQTGDNGLALVLRAADGGLHSLRSGYNPELNDNPKNFVSGDFNVDGRDDVALAGFSRISVFLNQIDGEQITPPFSEPLILAGREQIGIAAPRALLAEDLDSDGNLDLIASGYFRLPGEARSRASISVMRGRGDGSFFAAQVYYTHLTWTSSRDLDIGDIDGDGDIDAALPIAYQDSNESYGYIALFMNRGDGTFESRVISAGALKAETVGIGDLNGDGLAELVIGTNMYNPGILRVMIQSVSGSFRIGQTIFPSSFAGKTPYSMFLVGPDVDGDGKRDVIAGRGGWTQAT